MQTSIIQQINEVLRTSTLTLQTGNGFGDVQVSTPTPFRFCVLVSEVLHEDRNGNGVLDLGED